MLITLSIRNLAVVKTLDLEFHQGFNVLTGETGTGKSVLIEALSLLMGARARSEVVRDPDGEGSVSASFDLHQAPSSLLETLRGSGLLNDGDEERELVVHRTINGGKGRGRVFINGIPATVGMLRNMSQGLVEISGQHEYYSLLRDGAGLNVLDAFAGLGGDVSRYRGLYRRLRETGAELDNLRCRLQESESRADFLRFQLEEIRRIDPRPGEEDQLRNSRERLRHREKLLGALKNAETLLYSGRESAVSAIGQVQGELSRLSDVDPLLQRATNELDEARVVLEETVFSLRRLATNLGEDESNLESIEERLDLLQRLCRKHGPTLQDVVDRSLEMEAELNNLDNCDARLDELSAMVEQYQKQTLAAAAELSEKRRRAALQMSERITEELSCLMMGAAIFRVAVSRRDREQPHDSNGGEERHEDQTGLGPDGQDRVMLLFRPNKGAPFAPLARIASGGELSRVMLAVKSVLMEKDPCYVYVFDEIDAGIGGAAADAVGDRLQQVSLSHQVICVTHLPQIAALANHHLVVEKGERNGKTESTVQAVNGDRRVQELGRMLAGRDITDKALAHAEEMLRRRRVGAK